VARGDGFQLTSLVFGGLLAGGNAQIDRDALLCGSFVGHGHLFPFQ
jgi:hypothetical protein